MNLDFSNWKPFKLSDVFCLYNGAGITKEEIECNPGDFVAVQSGEDIAFSLQKAVTNATIKDTPMISVPVPTALPYFGTSSSLTLLRL